MRITFLGTGSSTPSPRQENKSFRSFSGMLVEIQGTYLLFDIGPGVVSKLLELGIDTAHNPTQVFISHFHIDHCLDYVTLAKNRALADYFGQNITPLSVYGPQGLKELSDDLFLRTKKWMYMNDQLKVYDVVHLKEAMDGVVSEGNNWKVSCKPIKHYDGNVYLLEAEGKRILYSGDMEYDETITSLGQGADLAVLECSYPDRASLQGKGAHLCPEDIGKLAIRGNFKKTFLTHLYPACEGREEEMIQKIEGMSPTKVTVAYDGLSLDL